MDLVEHVAKALHDGWMQYQEHQGVVYGPEKVRGVTHPHLVEWNQLKEDVESQNQDRFQAALILYEYANGSITEANLREKIHAFWLLWEKIHGTAKEHKHAKPYPEAHPDGPGEHADQAALIWPILKSIPSEFQ